MQRLREWRQQIEERYLDVLIAVFYICAVLFWADELPLKTGGSPVSIPMVLLLGGLTVFHLVAQLRKRAGRELRGRLIDFVQSASQTLAMALLIILFIVQAFKIPSESMLPTLKVGDHLLVNKFVYNFSEVERGDIVVFKFPPDPAIDYIKRVVGIPGDQLRIVDRQLFVNDEPWDIEEQIYLDRKTFEPARDSMAQISVPPGHYFVMGDNRDNSFDSRFWGFVPEQNILGEAFIIYFSWNAEQNSVRFDRVGKLVWN